MIKENRKLHIEKFVCTFGAFLVARRVSFVIAFDFLQDEWSEHSEVVGTLKPYLL